MMIWTKLNPHMTVDELGMIPEFLSDQCPDPAAVQLDRNYQHGGGWRPMEGFELLADGTLKYPGDPPLQPLAGAYLRDEKIILFECEIVAVIQPDRSFEACRMD